VIVVVDFLLTPTDKSYFLDFLMLWLCVVRRSKNCHKNPKNSQFPISLTSVAKPGVLSMAAAAAASEYNVSNVLAMCAMLLAGVRVFVVVVGSCWQLLAVVAVVVAVATLIVF
jgi:hypothetical protein